MKPTTVKSKDLVKGKDYWIEDSKRAFGIFHHLSENGSPNFTAGGGERINFFKKNGDGYIAFPKDEEFIEKSNYNIITADRG